MSPDEIVENLRCLGWREYTRTIRFAIKDNIDIAEENLIYAIIEIPEHYKISSLARYSNAVRPITKCSYESIKQAIIQEECVESYKEHLLQELANAKVVE
ncbi:hypothetical protein [Hahella chejuensis]|uniref:hypothetical protein n=1 Tax=Hahella chejuensis TaxID=158327 RepID=UPI0005A1CC9F|nr:hypothetical protein [Hahella chejuensis]